MNVDWGSKIITIHRADLTLVSGTLYKLDTDSLRLQLKALEDDEVGMCFPDTHRHNTEVTVAGVTYARVIEIINSYSITFDPDITYSVRLEGSNNNMFDIENGILNQNVVQVIPTNSAGLIVKSVGSGLSTDEHNQLMSLINGLTASQGTQLDYVQGLVQHNFRLKDQVYSGNNMTSATLRIYNNAADCTNDVTPMKEYSIVATYDGNNNCISYRVVE